MGSTRDQKNIGVRPPSSPLLAPDDYSSNGEVAIAQIRLRNNETPAHALLKMLAAWCADTLCEKSPPLAIARMQNTNSCCRSPPNSAHASYQSTCPKIGRTIISRLLQQSGRRLLWPKLAAPVGSIRNRANSPSEVNLTTEDQFGLPPRNYHDRLSRATSDCWRTEDLQIQRSESLPDHC